MVLDDCRMRLKLAIEAKSIHDGVGISSTGRQNNWIIDLRSVLLNSEHLTGIAELFWDKYADYPTFQLAGIETASIPLLTALLLRCPKKRRGINGFVVRKERKPTGRGQLIDGDVTDDPIIVVDDILNSGASLEKVRSVINSISRTISEVFVVIDFHSYGGEDWRRSNQLRVTSIFSLDEFGRSVGRKAVSTKHLKYKEVWRQKGVEGYAYHVVPKSAPILDGDRIFRGNDRGQMQCFDARSGEITWEFEATGVARTKGIWSTPALFGSQLYFGAYNGSMYCLDSISGAELWSHSYCEWIGSSPLVVPKHNLLYVGLEFERPWAKGGLTALDLETGEKVWEHSINKYQHGSAAYSAKHDLVLWGSADHDMLALDPKSGEIRWSFPTERSVKYAPAISDELNIVAFASFDKSIYVLDLHDGSLLGKWETDGICYTTPLIAGRKLFCGSADRHFYIIDLDSMDITARLNTNARVFASPDLIEGNVIFGTNGGKIIEMDLESFDIRGALQLPDAVTNKIAFNNERSMIYISTYMNDLYAYERRLDA